MDAGVGGRTVSVCHQSTRAERQPAQLPGEILHPADARHRPRWTRSRQEVSLLIDDRRSFFFLSVRNRY